MNEQKIIFLNNGSFAVVLILGIATFLFAGTIFFASRNNFSVFTNSKKTFSNAISSSQDALVLNVKQEEGGAIIEMAGAGFKPTMVTIRKGEAVTFINLDTEDRWPASNIHPTHQIYPEFNPKRPLKLGEKWSFIFNKPGSWRFHDHLYPEYTSVVNVAGESSERKDNKKLSLPSSDRRKEKELETANIFAVTKNENEVRVWLKKVGPKKNDGETFERFRRRFVTRLSSRITHYRASCL